MSGLANICILPFSLARTILTGYEDVQQFLKKFPNLKVVSIIENDNAKPPSGKLFKRFKQAYDQVPKAQRRTCLAFHGTAEDKIDSICTNGYDSSRRGTSYGQAYGAGEYFATDPSTSLSYCRRGKKMILNELLLGQNGVHHTQHRSIIVMKYPDHELPRYVITFQ